MKIRIGFVSNSSSCSFVIFGRHIGIEELDKYETVSFYNDADDYFHITESDRHNLKAHGMPHSAGVAGLVAVFKEKAQMIDGDEFEPEPYLAEFAEFAAEFAQPVELIGVMGGCYSSSQNMERYFTKAGKSYAHIVLVGGNKYLVCDLPDSRSITTTDSEGCSTDYNYIFNKKDGTFIRWGKTKDDDPLAAPAPEILDIEVSTICSNGCEHCYKSNTLDGVNMPFRTYKAIFDKLRTPFLTQIAFGVGDVAANADLWSIMGYTKSQGVTPNITVAGEVSQDSVKKLVKICGSVAVSLYDKDICYNTVEKLANAGAKQVNIHCLLSEETYERCMMLLDDLDARSGDARLKSLNAAVFLSLKKTGRADSMYTILSQDKFKTIVDKALTGSNIRFGFDSCSAVKFMGALDEDGRKKYKKYSESCESCRFSLYISVEGKAYPCSFAQPTEDFGGVDVLGATDFYNDIWNAGEIAAFRDNMAKKAIEQAGMPSCPLFDI